MNGIFKKGRKVAAAAVAMSLVGGAAFAAFSWYRSTGTASTADVNVTLPLTAVTEHSTSATLDAGSTGVPATYDMASMTETLTNSATGEFALTFADQYVGNTHLLQLTYVNSTSEPMKLTGVNITDAALAAFPGVAPFDFYVVRALTQQGNAGTGYTTWASGAGGSNPAACSSNTLAPGDTLNLAIRLGRTAATSAPFLLNVEFSPSVAAVTSTEATCALIPFTLAELEQS